MKLIFNIKYGEAVTTVVETDDSTNREERLVERLVATMIETFVNHAIQRLAKITPVETRNAN